MNFYKKIISSFFILYLGFICGYGTHLNGMLISLLKSLTIKQAKPIRTNASQEQEQEQKQEQEGHQIVDNKQLYSTPTKNHNNRIFSADSSDKKTKMDDCAGILQTPAGTPFGKNTPQRYVQKTKPTEILKVFISNILNYGKPLNGRDEVLFSMIHFLFKLDSASKQLLPNKKIIESQDASLENNLVFSNKEYHAGFFLALSSLFQKEKGIKYLHDFVNFIRQAKKKNISKEQLVSNFLEKKPDSFTQSLLDEMAKNSAGKKKVARLDTDKKRFLTVFFQYYAQLILENEQADNYEALVQYVLFYYVHLCHSSLGAVDEKQPMKPKVFRRLNFEESNDAKVCLRSHVDSVSFPILVSSVDNNQLLINLIEKTSCWLYIYFNAQKQVIKDCVDNILKRCSINKYDQEESYQIVVQLVEELINGLQITNSNDDFQSRHSVVRENLEMLFIDIKKILQGKYLLGSTFFCLSKFKPLVYIAKKIKCLLLKEEETWLDDVVLIKYDHIVQLTENDKQFGGGHLDCKVPYDGEDDNFFVEAKEVLACGTNGIHLVDWLISRKRNQQALFCASKKSTIFPICITEEGFLPYSELLYKGIINEQKDAQNISVAMLGDPMQLKESMVKAKKYAYLCEHDHSLICKKKDSCPYKGNIRVLVICQRDFINEKSDSFDKSNTLTTILTIYPYDVCCFDCDQSGLSYLGQPIRSDDDLKQFQKTFKHHQKDALKNIKKDASGKPLYEDFQVSYQSIIDIAKQARSEEKGQAINQPLDRDMMNLDGRAFQQNGNLYMMKKITDGLFVKVLIKNKEAA